ncbi:probable myosin-binding protein 4 [Diospyros lotus]|uniref:probable myosin-binding protein 4 n=1 Tax=Diospyros lotus TaxID=55363 RepID=UPI00225A0D01|nr:probable myosin-binding protein 4 [Diospyros lotus]
MVRMATKGTWGPGVNLERNPRGFMNLLSFMVSEWLLIFLLFIDAALSYLLIKFARYRKLQTPCLLCSRLDHVFGNEKPEFYRSLLCSNHRGEISSLASCNIHGKLADACGMCEECLTSFPTQNKLNSESFRLDIGKLGVDLDQHGLQNSIPNKNISLGSLSTSTCSCCNKIWRARPNAQRLLQLNPLGIGTVKPNAKPPLPRFQGRARLKRRDSIKKIRNKFAGPTPRLIGNRAADPLSHVAYTEVKITSDSESEFPFSEDDDGIFMACENIDTKEVLVDQLSSGELHSDNLAPAEKFQQASGDANLPPNVEGLAFDRNIRHGSRKFNWERANRRANPSPPPELISLDVIPSSSNVVEVPNGISANNLDDYSTQNSSIFPLSDLVPQNDLPPSSTVMEYLVRVPSEKNFVGTSDVENKSLIKHIEDSELMSIRTPTGFKSGQMLNDTASPMSKGVDSSEECKSTDSNKGREVYALLSEPDSEKVLDEILSIHGIDPSLTDTSPSVHDQHDELQRNDASSSNEILMLQKSTSSEMNDFGHEFVDGSSVLEIEGENVVDRLKQQVDHYKRCMSTLSRELEEERSASEVATNQAMAMITRLQEEKASMHMEALQYLRMMEEQAEYDMEALEKTNDLLAEREKEMQDLEAELEFYNFNFPGKNMGETLLGVTDNSKVRNTHIENGCIAHAKSSDIITCETSRTVSEDTAKKNNAKLDFEDEKVYISQCLKNLERKLNQVCCNKSSLDMPLDKAAIKNLTMSPSSGGIQTDQQKEENDLLMQKNLSALNAGLSTEEGSDLSVEHDDLVKGSNHLGPDGQESANNGGGNDLIALATAISDLNGRLEALEADRNFLEHAFNSLRIGDEGLHFIQEIAHQLQELRKIGVEKKSLCVP